MSNQKVRSAKKFVFRNGSRVSGVNAQSVGEELQRINEERGALRPSEVVNEARPESSPLHPAFEWNDSVAADEWRMHTARNLIRSVHVVDDSEEPVAVYVSVQSPVGKREYQPVEIVVNRPDLYGMAVYEAQQRINSAHKSLEDLEQAAGAADIDQHKLAAIQIAMQALATASGAVEALH